MTNTSITDEKRAATIRGLHSLADYLERHPDLPIPALGITVTHYVHDGSQVEQFADILEVGTREERGYLWAERSFAGDVAYRVHYTAPERMAAYYARESYTDNVQVSA